MLSPLATIPWLPGFWGNYLPYPRPHSFSGKAFSPISPSIQMLGAPPLLLLYPRWISSRQPAVRVALVTREVRKVGDRCTR